MWSPQVHSFFSNKSQDACIIPFQVHSGATASGKLQGCAVVGLLVSRRGSLLPVSIMLGPLSALESRQVSTYRSALVSRAHTLAQGFCRLAPVCCQLCATASGHIAVAAGLAYTCIRAPFLVLVLAGVPIEPVPTTSRALSSSRSTARCLRRIQAWKQTHLRPRRMAQPSRCA